MKLLIPLFSLVCLSSAIRSVARSTVIHREDIEWLDTRVFDGRGTKLPRVLLVGDSICLGYFGKVQTLLQGKASMAYLATSKAIPDPAYLEEVQTLLDEYKFDVIHFNNGLHGMDYTEREYERHLPDLIKLFRKMQPQAKLIWANSTSWRESAPNLDQFHPNNVRVINRNRIADQIVSKDDIPIDDLYGLVADHPDWKANDGVHFNDQGYAALANQVAEYVLKALKEK